MRKSASASLAFALLLAAPALADESSDASGSADSRRAALAADAAARIAQGNKPTYGKSDAGHALVRCVGIDPVPTLFAAADYPEIETVIGMSLNMIIGVEDATVMCANSVDGARVRADREWYCGGAVPECVSSRWINGAPSLAATSAQAVVFDLSARTESGKEISSVRLELQPLYDSPPK